MRHGSLFSGIGGFDLAAQWMGWENVFHCEWNPFGQKVLHHYWPNAEQFTDITKSDFTKYHGAVDIISGGFPCQPYSMAGKRLGKEDDRHLWPEMLRVIREVQPTWVVGENVFGLVNWSGGLVFHEVQSDLEAQGYEVQPYVLPAVSVNAPHRRDRVWFVAKNANENGWGGEQRKEESKERRQWHTCSRNNECISSDNGKIKHNKERIVKHSYSIVQEWRMHEVKSQTSNGQQFSQSNAWDVRPTRWQNFPTQSPICNGDDGLSGRLDGITFPKWRAESIKAGGNAIVPQVAYQIFKSIEDYERLH
jgi:DNA (cytosine-5)-methyltransferase 1